MSTVWDLITAQFRFSQEGVSQSWLFWTIILGAILLKRCYYKGFKSESK